MSKSARLPANYSKEIHAYISEEAFLKLHTLREITGQPYSIIIDSLITEKKLPKLTGSSPSWVLDLIKEYRYLNGNLNQITKSMYSNRELNGINLRSLCSELMKTNTELQTRLKELEKEF